MVDYKYGRCCSRDPGCKSSTRYVYRIVEDEATKVKFDDIKDSVAQLKSLLNKIERYSAQIPRILAEIEVLSQDVPVLISQVENCISDLED